MFKKDILGVRVDMGLGMSETVAYVEALIKGEQNGNLVCTTNSEFIIEAQKDDKFKEIVNSSALSVPDGIGVIAADSYLDKVVELRSKVNKVNKVGVAKDPAFPVKAFFMGILTGLDILSGKFSQKRITGVSLCEELFKLSSEKGYSIFLLGGWPRNWAGKRIAMDEDFAKLTSEAVEKKYPGVNIIGASSKFSREEIDDEKTVGYIKDVMRVKNINTIDILLVAYNQNKQEKWISRNALKIPAKVSVGVGGTFDYLVGHYKQVPDTMTKMGLDWLFRLVTQPFRIRRIFNAFPIFPIKIFLFSLKNKIR